MCLSRIEALTEKEKKLDDVLVLLTEAQIATQQSLQETERRFQETDRRIDKLVEAQMETDKRFHETGESFREIGERIDNLVSGIAALLRTKPV